MAQKYTEARKEGNKKWDAANLDRLSIAVPKGQKAIIQNAAATHSESVNQFIIRAIRETIARDTAAQAAESRQDAAGTIFSGPAVYLHPETLKRAQDAAQRTGESVSEFVERAVEAYLDSAE